MEPIELENWWDIYQLLIDQDANESQAWIINRQTGEVKYIKVKMD